MKANLWFSAISYGLALLLGLETARTGDGGFALMGLLQCALGAGFLDLAFDCMRRCP